MLAIPVLVPMSIIIQYNQAWCVPVNGYISETHVPCRGICRGSLHVVMGNGNSTSLFRQWINMSRSFSSRLVLMLLLHNIQVLLVHHPGHHHHSSHNIHVLCDEVTTWSWGSSHTALHCSDCKLYVKQLWIAHQHTISFYVLIHCVTDSLIICLSGGDTW